MQYLYLIKCQQFYKIGIANDVQSRLAQLSTGNPHELKVLAFYGYENAELVERVIHQKFANKRVRGEWFELDLSDIANFQNICQMLDGYIDTLEVPTVDNEQIEEADIAQRGQEWDYAAMFSDGWRMEYSGNGRAGEKNRFWIWRRSKNGKRESIYGGTVGSLPHSMDDLRRMYQRKYEAE